MNSSIVSREIKGAIWKVLKLHGFSVFTARSAWRYDEDRIDVFNFQSFSRQIADSLGVTTFSFSINLSCYLGYIPPRHAPTLKNGKLTPQEYECPFRHRLLRGMEQPGNKDREVWSIASDGADLPWCIHDAEEQLPKAFEWYSRFATPGRVLENLLEDERADLANGEAPSPIHYYLTGYAALKAGDELLARDKFEKAVESNCFPHFFRSAEGAIYRAI